MSTAIPQVRTAILTGLAGVLTTPGTLVDGPFREHAPDQAVQILGFDGRTVEQASGYEHEHFRINGRVSTYRGSDDITGLLADALTLFDQVVGWVQSTPTFGLADGTNITGSSVEQTSDAEPDRARNAEGEPLVGFVVQFDFAVLVSAYLPIT